MKEIPDWFPYLHLIIPILALWLLHFHRAIYSHTFCRSKSSDIHMQLLTKCLLILTLLFSYSYLVCTSLQTMFMFLPHDSLTTFPPSICPLLSSYRILSYVSGRCLLYSFFTSRTNDVFKNTYLRFTTPFKCLLSFYLLLVLLTVVGAASFIYFQWLSWSISTTLSKTGTFCVAENARDGALQYLKYVLIWGSFHDVILSMLTVLSMASRLFSLIVESESSHKSHHSRFSIGSQLSFMSQRMQTCRDEDMLREHINDHSKLKREQTSDRDLNLFGPLSPTKTCTETRDHLDVFPRSPSIIITDLSATATTMTASNHRQSATTTTTHRVSGVRSELTDRTDRRQNGNGMNNTNFNMNRYHMTSIPLPVLDVSNSRTITSSKVTSDGVINTIDNVSTGGGVEHRQIQRDGRDGDHGECKEDQSRSVIHRSPHSTPVNEENPDHENDENEHSRDRSVHVHLHISTTTVTGTPIPIRNAIGSPISPFGSPGISDAERSEQSQQSQVSHQSHSQQMERRQMTQMTQITEMRMSQITESGRRQITEMSQLQNALTATNTNPVVPVPDINNMVNMVTMTPDTELPQLPELKAKSPTMTIKEDVDEDEEEEIEDEEEEEELEEPEPESPEEPEPEVPELDDLDSNDNDNDNDLDLPPVVQRAMTTPVTPSERISVMLHDGGNRNGNRNIHNIQGPTTADFAIKIPPPRSQSAKTLPSATSSKKGNSRLSAPTTTITSGGRRLTLPTIQDLNEPAVRTSTGNVFSGHDALTFHEKTEDQNDTILLISKFCVILCCVIASSQTALISYLVFPQLVMITYSVDTFVNTICLYLSFAFSRQYYDHYFCGKWCTRCCFPIIKTISLLCSSYKRRHGEGSHKTCWVYCRCCCFGYCCDPQMDWEGTESIWALARFEVELMVMTDENKKNETNEVPTTPSTTKRSSTKRPSTTSTASTNRRPVDQGG